MVLCVNASILERWRHLLVLVLPLLGLIVAAPAEAAVTVPNTPEPSWGVDGRVYATVIQGDTVFVGGAFTHATSSAGQTLPRIHLAAFDLRTGEPLDWRADVNATVRAMVSDGTWLYLGGSFGRIAGQSHQRVGRVSIATASPDAAFAPSADGMVRALSLRGDSIYLGGAFTSVDGATRQHVANVATATGALDPTFSASVNGEVWGIATNAATDRVYLAGRYSSVNGVSRTGVAAVSADTGGVTGPAFTSSARPTLGLALDDDATHLFGAGGSGTNSAAAWNTSNGARIWHVSTDGDIQAIAYHDGTVYFGFHDGYRGDGNIKLLAADAVTGQVDPDFQPRFEGSFWGVFAITAVDGAVVIGGEFSRVAGVRAGDWARFVTDDQGGPVTTPVVSEDDAWQWWFRSDAPPAEWNQAGFDANGWDSGAAPLGWGAPGPIATDIDTFAQPQDRARAAYFRKEVTLNDVSAVSDFQLSTVADDGVVVYVNGVEVGRSSMPAGTVTFTTYASSANSTPDANANPVVIDVPTSLLHDGVNVIAAETHVNYRNTRNVSFKLSATVTTDG